MKALLFLILFGSFYSVGSPSAGGLYREGQPIKSDLTIDVGNASPEASPDPMIKMILINQFIIGDGSKENTPCLVYDPGSHRLFSVDRVTNRLEIYEWSDSAEVGIKTSISLSEFGNFHAHSVAIHNDLVALTAYKEEGVENGRVLFFNIDGKFQKSVEVGVHPGILLFTPNGKKVLVANEGRFDHASGYDPLGSISIIDLSAGLNVLDEADITHLDFESFNAKRPILEETGVCIFRQDATVAEDLEPTSITLSNDGNIAFVICQENNALAMISLQTNLVLSIQSFGYKDWTKSELISNLSADTLSDRYADWPIKGMRQPGGIDFFTFNSIPLLITANTGAFREYPGFRGCVRLNDSTYVLDPHVFPNAQQVKEETLLGKLAVTTLNGDMDGDGDYDEIYTFGGRSFSIWDPISGELVYDSGNELVLESSHITGQNYIEDFLDATGKPLATVVGEVNGKPYAFLSLANGGVLIYDLSDPLAPKLVQHHYPDFQNAIERDWFQNLLFIPAAESPTGFPLIIAISQESGTVMIYQVWTPEPAVVGFAAADKLILERDSLISIELLVEQTGKGAEVIEIGVSEASTAVEGEDYELLKKKEFIPELYKTDRIVIEDNGVRTEFPCMAFSPVGNRLVVAYRVATSHYFTANACYQIEYSDDYGKTWNYATTIYPLITKYEFRDGEMSWDTVSNQFYLQLNEVNNEIQDSTHIRLFTSKDGIDWSLYSTIIPPLGGFVDLRSTGKPLRLMNGDLVFTAYSKYDTDGSSLLLRLWFLRSRDDGLSWEKELVDVSLYPELINEASLVIRSDGIPVMFTRVNDINTKGWGGVYRYVASDTSATTWMPPKEVTPPNYRSAKPSTYLFSDGILLLGYRQLHPNMGRPAYALSIDYGDTWSEKYNFHPTLDIHSYISFVPISERVVAMAWAEGNSRHPMGDVDLYYKILTPLVRNANDLEEAPFSLALAPQIDSLPDIQLKLLDNDREGGKYLILEMETSSSVTGGKQTNFLLLIKDNDPSIPQAPLDPKIKLSHLKSLPMGIEGNVAYDPESESFVLAKTHKNLIEIWDFARFPYLIEKKHSINLSDLGGRLVCYEMKDDYMAIAVQDLNKAQSGSVLFFNTDGKFINRIELEGQPILLALSPHGRKVITANKTVTEQNRSISIIDYSQGIRSISKQDLTNIPLNINDINIELPGSGDPPIGSSTNLLKSALSPSFLKVNQDGSKIYVVCQDNNLIVMIDLRAKAIEKVWQMGYKNWLNPRQTLDASDVVEEAFFANWSVKGIMQPGMVDFFEVNGDHYLISANGGRALSQGREFGIRLGDEKVKLDPVAFPYAKYLKKDHLLGRMRIAPKMGDHDGDGDLDELFSYGGRSFSIWAPDSGDLLYESANEIEQIIANDSQFGSIFNSSNRENKFKGESGNRGPEPKPIVTGKINGTTYAFIGLKQIGGMVVYDLSDPVFPRIYSIYQHPESGTFGWRFGA